MTSWYNTFLSLVYKSQLSPYNYAMLQLLLHRFRHVWSNLHSPVLHQYVRGWFNCSGIRQHYTGDPQRKRNARLATTSLEFEDDTTTQWWGLRSSVWNENHQKIMVFQLGANMSNFPGVLEPTRFTQQSRHRCHQCTYWTKPIEWSPCQYSILTYPCRWSSQIMIIRLQIYLNYGITRM